jgi:glycosyltransferase involved in cell wall biosynthesis
MKTVSVVMATYNGEEYLSEQIDSILAQSYPVYELIIQDDCSTDGTTDIVRRYMEKYTFIKLFVNERNVGFNENFRLAAMHATGDFVAFSDQDDIWFPQKLERQVVAIGDAAICFSNTLDGEALDKSPKLLDHRCFFEGTILSNQVSGHTMLCRREFVQNPDCWLGSDIFYDQSLTLHALMGSGLVKISEPLNLHRRLPRSVTHYALPTVTWQPYLYGWSAYRRWQSFPAYNRLHTYIYNKTLDTRHQTVNRMCQLMLHRDLLSLLRLCWLCMKHREKTYYTKPASGIMGIIRGFFYPQQVAYQWWRRVNYDKQTKHNIIDNSNE